MNMEIGAEAALLPEKEYINGVLVAVHNPFTVLPSFPYLPLTPIRERDTVPFWMLAAIIK